ncbi:chemotaxis protein CheA [Hydrocarboniphaga sp.]|uniref:chemotaxis protein CheA n=1 Tax=Hydrocarboniphaga sp. TaxID=2033016 RepID=UPI002ABC9D4A|nr:chemotaxis protein CheA [Hydrocarboniphaga sp.]MDZ4077921.1 chemotaxis protein CheA [Hydrocarboniphaga sp.]
MAIDLARFHQAFFEESFERADAMEQALLQLDVQADNGEVVNDIFRAAHSIKGGAATFGFAAVAGFTHHLETLLDSVRSGQRGVDAALVELMLRAADHVRGLLVVARDGGAHDEALGASLQSALQAALGAPSVAADTPAAEPAKASTGWAIRFVPMADLFRSGNDPLRILRELAELGSLHSELEFADGIPGFGALDAESCYLRWNLRLETLASESEVRELFAWVEDECELHLEQLSAAVAVAEPVVAAPEAAPPAAANGEDKVVPIGAAAPARTQPQRNPAAALESSIRVSTNKIDGLINLVGELVITQASLSQYAQGLDPLGHERLLSAVQQLEHTTRRLQESVMSTRMLPIDAVFSRFPRMVHDLATKLGKQVRLQTVGEGTELDKSVIERIGDPLTHLLRNAIDHGIESIDDRVAAGKPAQGTVTLRAAHQAGQIVIDIADDGRGLSRARILEKARSNGIAVADNASDADVWNLIFAPGFSTASEVTDVSGRGVGMDVVKRNILSLGGQVELSSTEGQGATVRIRLPLTLAIVDGMSVAVGEDTYIVPLSSVVECLQPTVSQIKRIGADAMLVAVRSEYLPLLDLHTLFGLPGAGRDAHESILVIVEAEGRKVALQLDELLGQQQVVIKSLEANYRRLPLFSGATILGDGRVALILDIVELVRGAGRAMAA